MDNKRYGVWIKIVGNAQSLMFLADVAELISVPEGDDAKGGVIEQIEGELLLEGIVKVSKFLLTFSAPINHWALDTRQGICVHKTMDSEKIQWLKALVDVIVDLHNLRF